MTTTADPEFEALLEHVRRSRGSDFGGYKRSTLVRRFRKRMGDVGVESYADYAAYLDGHADEFTALFNTILINVTGFFRDPEAWEALSREVLAPLAARKSAGQPIRVWTAGCASGEESYTVVMALVEALGEDAFRERVKVYATDMDDEALAHARGAVYPAAAVEAVPEPLRARYFEAQGGQCTFRPDLRRLVIFGRHDLVKDAPISHLDLLVSRNTLMYFNRDVQDRILNRFHFALDDDGVLFLGKAEMMRTRGALFAPLDLKARLFSRVHRTPLRDRLLTARPPDAEGEGQAAQAQARAREELRLRQAALDAEPSAQVVVSPAGTVLLANAPARTLFGLSPGDVGRPLQDLTLSYRPVELRAKVEQVMHERRALRVEHAEHAPPGGDLRAYEVQMAPLLEGKVLLGVSIVFVDVTAADRLQAEVQEARQEMETAYEELQSTNEELETTNEELQSTNEELETMNDELARRGADLDVLNAYLGAVLSSVRVAVVVVDAQSDIRVWSRRAEELWGLREEEAVGQALQNLDIGLPVERLKAAVRACIEGRSEVEEAVLEAVNRRGRAVGCRVSVAPLRNGGRSVSGAVLVMEELPAEEGAG